MALFDFTNEKNAPAPEAGDRGRSSRPVTPYTVAWPQLGSGVDALIGTMKFKVFIDASFVKSPAFAAFRHAWHAIKAEQYPTRYYHIPSYEAQKLTAEEQALVVNEDCRQFSCTDPAHCFIQMMNRGLNWNILWLTDSSAHGTEVQAAANQTGRISLRWYGMDQDGKLKSLPAPTKDTPAVVHPEKASPTTAFRPTTTQSPISRAARPVFSVPGSGASVTASAQAARYILREPVMTDHSSITYKTNDPGVFAKIYTVQALQIDIFENKARRMVQEQLHIEGVCWPKDLLLDAAGSFVGILVPASKGVQLSRSILNGTVGLSQHFPTWDKRDICVAAQTIIRAICALHGSGVRLGCFNPASVYVESPKKVYFVDTDAWQIEGYPVVSRNTTFTPPELLSEGKKLHMFTQDEENYQVALLAFMLMLPGKYPYAKRNRNSEDESLRNMSFPFSIGDDMKRSADAERPSGAWQIVWDHLPYRMCYNFYHTFHPRGNFSSPGTRLKASVWLELIAQFEAQLSSADSAASRVLFPRTFRRDGKRTFVRCRICGQEHPTFYFLRNIKVQGELINIWDKGYRICLPCAVDQSKAPNAKFTCQHCNREFFYTNRTQVMHEIGKMEFNWNQQKWCHDCKKQTEKCSRCCQEVPLYQIKTFHDNLRNQDRSVCGKCFGDLIKEDQQRRDEERQRKNRVYRTAICRNCRRSFNITQGDAEYFLGKGKPLPNYCPTCRRR